MSPEHREVAGRSGRWRDAMKWPSVPPLFSSVTLPGGTLGTLFPFSLHTKKKEGMREGRPCSKRAVPNVYQAGVLRCAVVFAMSWESARGCRRKRTQRRNTEGTSRYSLTVYARLSGKAEQRRGRLAYVRSLAVANV